MDIFLKATAGVLITVLMSLALSKQAKDFSYLLVLSVCAMISLIAVQFLEPVISFVKELESMSNLKNNLLKILLKSVGIGFLSEITVQMCTDTGNAALGKAVQMLANAIILWLAIPIFTALLDLIQQILVTT